MQSNKRNRFSRFAGRVLVALLAAVALSSCERIFEDLDPCLHGVSLRFVYAVSYTHLTLPTIA